MPLLITPLASISSHNAATHSINNGTRGIIREIDAVFGGESITTTTEIRREQQTTASLVDQIGRILKEGAIAEVEPSREWPEIVIRDDSGVSREKSIHGSFDLADRPKKCLEISNFSTEQTSPEPSEEPEL